MIKYFRKPDPNKWWQTVGCLSIIKNNDIQIKLRPHDFLKNESHVLSNNMVVDIKIIPFVANLSINKNENNAKNYFHYMHEIQFLSKFIPHYLPTKDICLITISSDIYDVIFVYLTINNKDTMDLDIIFHTSVIPKNNS